MPFTIDFLKTGPVTWTLTGDVDDPCYEATRHPEYTPTIYAVAAEGMATTTPDAETCRATFAALRDDLTPHPAVVATAVEQRRPGFRFAEQPVLRVDVDRVGAVDDVAQYVEDRGPPGRVPYRAFDVDFSPGFRFCLDRDCSPAPPRPPTVLELGLSETALADEDLSELTIAERVTAPTAPGGEPPGDVPQVAAGETTHEVLETVRDRLAAANPDVLVVERAAIIPLLVRASERHGVTLGLQRTPADATADAIPPYRQRAGASTFESYGQVRHSPARYVVPGRVVVDRSNTFFLAETTLGGCLELVDRSRKPLGELAWASIGNVLTAIQICEARDRGVLVQWRAWRPERFKTARQLHAADRGGTTLSPEVGVHEDVYELDFASLYPNIICEHNLSPETVRCRCHDREDVPDLGYAVCDEPGYLPAVLQPLLDRRAAIKRALAGDPGPDRRAALEGQSSAIKWILVSCFGYQGFSNAKFGRIEVHEAINAYARDLLLTAKEQLEAAGWRVLHGIVDSLWVTPRDGTDAGDRTPLGDVAQQVTDDVGIRLEREGRFDWVAFCPRRTDQSGALTRYFGRRASDGDGDGDDLLFEDRFKTRGIECRQRSTCEWVAARQRAYVTVLDDHRDPQAVCRHLRADLRTLAVGDVDTTRLVRTVRPSKPRGDYDRNTRTAAAVARAADRGHSPAPGRDVQFVVVDDDHAGPSQVQIATEIDPESDYDGTFYADQVIRAAASVVGPYGWQAADVREALDDGQTLSLSSFTV